MKHLQTLFFCSLSDLYAVRTPLPPFLCSRQVSESFCVAKHPLSNFLWSSGSVLKVADSDCTGRGAVQHGSAHNRLHGYEGCAHCHCVETRCKQNSLVLKERKLAVQSRSCAYGWLALGKLWGTIKYGSKAGTVRLWYLVLKGSRQVQYYG